MVTGCSLSACYQEEIITESKVLVLLTPHPIRDTAKQPTIERIKPGENLRAHKDVIFLLISFFNKMSDMLCVGVG